MFILGHIKRCASVCLIDDEVGELPGREKPASPLGMFIENILV